jgi:uncharacterized coiled-coil protein SlyX
MEDIQFSESDLAFMDKYSADAKPTTEYADGDMYALATQMNSAVALYQRGKFQNEAVDTTQYEGKDFTVENIFDTFRKQGYGDKVVSAVAGDASITGWGDAERRLKYLEDYYQKEEQVAENFTTAGMIALGLPLAIVDIDSLAISPFLAAANKTRKALNLSSKMSQVASHTTVGAGVGLLSMATYEAATGVYRDDSLIESAMVGAALGGSLGYLVSKGQSQPSLNYTTDSKGNQITPEDAKVIQIREQQNEVDYVNKAIDELDAVLKETKATEAELKQTERGFVENIKAINRSAKETLKVEKGAAKQTWKDSLAVRNEQGTVLKGVTDSLKAITRKVESTAKSIRVVAEQTEVIKTLKKQATPIKGNITKVQNQLAKFEGKFDEKSLAKVKELETRLDSYQKELGTVNAKVVRAETAINKQPAESDKLLTEYVKQEKELKLQVKDNTAKYDQLVKEVNNNKSKYSSLVKQERETKITPDKQDVIDYRTTAPLTEKLQQLKVDATPQGLQKLLERKGLLEGDLAKMKADDFNIENLRGIKKVKKNYIDKLAKELDDIGKVNDLTQSNTFKQLPEWARKLMISPITKLLNSPIRAVAGFASLLHSGTVYQGRINNMTAWTIKQMDDMKLDRMHKAIINLYSEAKKEGYTKGIEEFRLEVSNVSYKMTGAIERTRFKDMPATASYEERLEIARKRDGSVEYVGFSNNKFVNEAAKEHLKYYEYIQNRANNLDLESLRGTFKQGYIKRVYDVNKLNDYGRDRAVEDLVAAQIAKANYVGKPPSTIDIEEFTALAKTAVDETISGEARRKAVTTSLGMPRQTTTSSEKQRTIDVFDDDIAHLLSDDLVNTTSLYGVGMHGRLALKEKLGVDNNEQLEAMFDQLMKNDGASQKDIDNLRVVTQTILGTREVSKNPYDPFTRGIKAVSTATSALHTLAFAIPTITEVASIAKEFGLSRTLENLIGRPRDIYNMYKNGLPSDKNTIELLISYGDAHFNMKANRYDVENSMFDIDRFEAFGSGVVQKEAIFGGLLPTTDMLRMTTTALYVDFLARMSVAKKISSADMKRIEDMGFDPTDLSRIRDTLKVQPDGRIGNMDRKTWGALDRELTAGALTTVERTILHPNGITLPKFMTNMEGSGIVPRVFAKFLRFPIESYERMLVRGIQEADAKQAIGFATNVGMWAGILAMKDALREEDKQQYTEDEGSLIKDALLYNSFTSSLVVGVDTASGLLTGENFTNDFRYNIGGAVTSNLTAFQRGDVNVRVPMGSINITDAFTGVLQQLNLVEETNKE